MDVEEMDDATAVDHWKALIVNPRTELKERETAIYKLGGLYAKMAETRKLVKLLSAVRPIFSKISKAKTAKMVRSLLEMVSRIPDTLDLQIQLCRENIEWCIEQKRAYLRQRIQTRLCTLLLESGQFAEALTSIEALMGEVKKLDDKLQLVEVHLIESRIHHALRNVPRARASLTSARTAANSVYIDPQLQAAIDLQGGTLLAEDRDYKTAYSYFFEAFEGYDSMSNPAATRCLKYMLLCKVMTDDAEDVRAIITGKHGINHRGRQLDALSAVADAAKSRSLSAFEEAQTTYAAELVQDELIKRHIGELQAKLLEQNLIRIIEPYSQVELEHVASKIALPVRDVETKLSQMILDEKLHGTLDQGRGVLIVYDEPAEDPTYTSATKVIAGMGDVVDSLFKRAAKLSY
eukprot:PLAT5723.1.p2 GENE.PLAT5723.1~~PLAT5723.1.p2  ORF type:complete len:433 (-),score=222.43 PLAT5723.1:132-1349(-)